MKHLFTIREVAEQTGMSVTTIRRSLAHISHYRRGGKRQILFSQEADSKARKYQNSIVCLMDILIKSNGWFAKIHISRLMITKETNTTSSESWGFSFW